MLGLIGNVGPWELILVLAILLVIVGPGKLPKVGEAMGKALGNFRKARSDEFDELDSSEQEKK